MQSGSAGLVDKGRTLGAGLSGAGRVLRRRCSWTPRDAHRGWVQRPGAGVHRPGGGRGPCSRRWRGSPVPANLGRVRPVLAGMAQRVAAGTARADLNPRVQQPPPHRRRPDPVANLEIGHRPLLDRIQPAQRRRCRAIPAGQRHGVSGGHHATLNTAERPRHGDLARRQADVRLLGNDGWRTQRAGRPVVAGS